MISSLAMFRPFGVLVAFGLAVGPPAYYVWIKRRAEASLKGLLAERFSPIPCPVANIQTGRGPVQFKAAYRDNAGTGFILLIGNWRRSRTAYNIVSGLYKPGVRLDASGSERNGQKVLIAVNSGGGDVVVWEALPSRESVLAQFQSVRPWAS